MTHRENWMPDHALPSLAPLATGSIVWLGTIVGTAVSQVSNGVADAVSNPGMASGILTLCAVAAPYAYKLAQQLIEWAGFALALRQEADEYRRAWEAERDRRLSEHNQYVADHARWQAELADRDLQLAELKRLADQGKDGH